MTKKDRIAVSISVVGLSIGTVIGIFEHGEGPVIFSIIFLLVTSYWLYRFIKGNPKTANDKSIGAIDSKADALLKWNDLLAKGAITQEEYDKAKRDLLG